MPSKGDRKQNTGIGLVKYQRIRERAVSVVEELPHVHIENRPLGVVEKDLNPCADRPRPTQNVFVVTKLTGEDPMDAAGSIHVQKDIPAVLDMLEVPAIQVPARAIPGARHGSV